MFVTLHLSSLLEDFFFYMVLNIVSQKTELGAFDEKHNARAFLNIHSDHQHIRSLCNYIKTKCNCQPLILNWKPKLHLKKISSVYNLSVQTREKSVPRAHSPAASLHCREKANISILKLSIFLQVDRAFQVCKSEEQSWPTGAAPPNDKFKKRNQWMKDFTDQPTYNFLNEPLPCTE